ncbi:MAG: hypothetical protein GY694_13100 [Gammaproteobacteria bacterium]|nr:hypothetical protein [Gammaproteobacteria bacterium]
MEALIRLFWDICRFKKGADNIPFSLNLLLIILFTNLIIESFLGLTVYTFSQSIILAASSIVALFLFIWIWLFLFKLSNRFLQTALAFSGVSLFTNVICFIPLALLWKLGILSDDSFGLLNLILIGWILAIYAHIFQGALNITFFLGFALAITYFITFNTVTIKILGV